VIGRYIKSPLPKMLYLIQRIYDYVVIRVRAENERRVEKGR
jgi:hypothetical protein